MTSLQGKTLFVTWWTSGIARATIIQAAHKGANVSFVARRAPLAQALIDKLISQWISSDSLLYHECDVTDFDQLQSAISNTQEKWGPINSLFCCAGTHITGDILTTSLDDWDRLWTLNVTHMFMAMKAIIPQMQTAGGGSIVLMGSDQTFVAKSKSSIYGATKAAIGQLTKSTALDFADDNIRVNAVCPGTIETPQALQNAKKLANISFEGNIDAAKHELSKGQMIDRRGTPDEVANVVCFLLSDEASFMTWSLVSVDGGYVAN